MASGNEMRVGDAEREATAAELREHYASGRLTLDELNERLDAAFAARTRADLNAVMTDLPSARPGSAGGKGWSAAGGPSSRPFGPGGQQSGAAGPFGPGGQGGGGPFGPSGPFGPQGPFGASGPFGHDGPFGPRGRFGAGGGIARSAPVRTAGAFLTTMLVMGALFLFGILGVFGIGAGRPFGIVLILAALALLRRLVFGRRRIRACGPRGRRRW